jgi:hypothetical protein
MGLEVIWTKKAIDTFGKRIAYLEEIGRKRKYLISLIALTCF